MVSIKKVTHPSATVVDISAVHAIFCMTIYIVIC